MKFKNQTAYRIQFHIVKVVHFSSVFAFTFEFQLALPIFMAIFPVLKYLGQ